MVHATPMRFAGLKRQPFFFFFLCFKTIVLWNTVGRPSHYFFVLIRYGPCNVVATPLATAADAQSGDAISFQTSVTL